MEDRIDDQGLEMKRIIIFARDTLNLDLVKSETDHLSDLINESERLLRDKGAYDPDTIRIVRNLSSCFTSYSRNVISRNEKGNVGSNPHIPGY